MSKSILIVEDDVLVRLHLADFFADAGWRVLDAHDADRAILILDQCKEMTVVLTDVHMPGPMDGINLAQYVKKNFPLTLLVVISGKVPPSKQQLPVCATFIPKPFDPYRLLQNLNEMAD